MTVLTETFVESPTTGVECLISVNLAGQFSISGDGSIHLLAPGHMYDLLSEIGLPTAEVGDIVGWYAGIADVPSKHPITGDPIHLERRKPREGSTIWMRPSATGGELEQLGRATSVL